MTKTDVFALGTRGDHVTYLYFIVGDDHPVDQQLIQLSPLLEGGICKSATRPPLAFSARRLTFRRRRGCGIIGSTLWKRLLAGIFGLIGLVVWKRFLGEKGEAQSAPRDILTAAPGEPWTKSSFMSGREFEHFMADLFRTAGYKVDVVRGTGDQGVDLLILVLILCSFAGFSPSRGGGTRTHTPSQDPDFKSGASADSATPPGIRPRV